MKKVLLITIFLILMTGLFSDEYDFCDHTLLVVLTPEMSSFDNSLDESFFGNFPKTSVENISLIYDENAILRLTQSISRGEIEFNSIYEITLPTNDHSKVLEAIEELNQIEGIELAEPNYIVSTAVVPNDEYWTHYGLWALKGGHGINAQEAWEITTGSHNVRVGVIDTGISHHVDLAANRVSGKNVVWFHTNTDDENGHGSHVAGIAGAVGNNGIGTVGVSWNVSLVPIKITRGSSGDTHVARYVRAINWATNNNVDILNLSFSRYGKDRSMKRAINSYPGLFVWAAGNQTTNVDTRKHIGMSSHNNLIAVGAINQYGNRPDFSNYSASGNHVHIYAPGYGINSTVLNNGYDVYDGTSMAAPFVSGVAALMLSVNPNLSASELKTLILDNADHIQISTPDNPSQTVRRLNAYKAVFAATPFTVYDLVAYSLTGLEKIIINQPATYTMRVLNNTTVEVNPNNYTVKLMSGSIELATLPGQRIVANGFHDFHFTWTPKALGNHQISGHIIFEKDQNPANNITLHSLPVEVLSDVVVYVGEEYIGMPNHFDNLQTAIDNTPNGGTIYVSAGYGSDISYIPPHNNDYGYKLNNKDITIIGSNNNNNPSIIVGYFDFTNVTNETIVENFVFNFTERNMGYYPKNQTILLENSNPRFNNLTFKSDLENYPQYIPIGIRAIFDYHNPNRVLEIKNSSFQNGISIAYNSQGNDNLLMIDNCIFSGRAVSLSGGSVDILTSTFNYTSSNGGITDSILDLWADNINISNNNFIMTAFNEHNRMPRCITANSMNQINIERNVFRTIGSMNQVPAGTIVGNKIVINPNDVNPIVGVPHARIYNNTDYAAADFPAYRFIHHTTDVDIKNSLITGSIEHYNMSNNTSKITYSWIVKPENIPNYPIVSNIFTGNPNIDTVTYRPIWTSTTKSGLIDAGYVPDNFSWFGNPEYLDPDNTRIDIGAFPVNVGHRQFYHDFLPVPAGPYVVSYEFHWVSFPYIDNLYEGESLPANDLHYVLEYYNNNSFITENNVIEWKYNDDIGSYGHTHPNVQPIYTPYTLDSRYGYKLTLPSTSGQLITGGFPPDDLILTVKAKERGTLYREIWVGYFLSESSQPFDALQDIIDDLIMIKTQKWAMSRVSTSHNWVYPSVTPWINQGEAVVLHYVGNVDKNFTWKLGSIDPLSYSHPVTQYFSFEEQIDYTPIYIELPEDMVGEETGEIALFIDDVCYGAEVITGEIIQLNAYIMDVDLEDAVVEFRYHEYSNEISIQGIHDFGTVKQEFKTISSKTLDLSQNSLFYVVSLKEEAASNDEQISITTLENNYPNPFNPTTSISYNLGQTGNVRLQIFNIRGQLVNTLVDDVQNAGRYTVEWHGIDTNLNPVSSGIYFYRLETMSGTETKRMLLMK